MMFRDDLYQANRRIERVEQELVQARADRDHLSGRPAERRDTVRVDLPRKAAPVRHDLGLLAWWPVVVTPLLAVIAVLMMLRDVDTWAEFPLDWVFGSAILGGTLYSIDVLLRWTRGDRTMINRLIIVAACIAGGPALLTGFLLFGGLMGYVAPIAAVLVMIGWVIHWIVKG